MPLIWTNLNYFVLCKELKALSFGNGMLNNNNGNRKSVGNVSGNVSTCVAVLLLSLKWSKGVNVAFFLWIYLKRLYLVISATS